MNIISLCIEKLSLKFKETKIYKNVNEIQLLLLYFKLEIISAKYINSFL